jgi:hypothetical protein
MSAHELREVRAALAEWEASFSMISIEDSPGPADVRLAAAIRALLNELEPGFEEGER